MALKQVRVSVRHYMTIDIPDHLLQDGEEDTLDDFLYDEFIESDWIFDDVSIKDVR